MEEMNNQLLNFVSVVCSLTLSTEKHEIYATAFGSNLFYDLFLQGPLGTPSDPLLAVVILKCYRSSTVNLNTVNSKFHLIRCFCQILARILSFHV